MSSSVKFAGLDTAGMAAACLALDRAVFDVLRSEASLATALGVLCLAVEEQCPGMLCSIQVLNQSGTHLLYGAAPSLPESYNPAAHGIPIEASACWSGVAAYLQSPVVVSDVATDPRWAKFREPALQHGLRACWSSPIPSREKKVLGTFTVYFRQPRAPSRPENELLTWAIQLSGMVIERKQADQSLRKHREELQIILDSAPVMVWYKDKENRIVRANQRAADFLGLRKHELEGRSVYDLFPDEAAKFHQDDLDVIRSGKPKLGIHGFQGSPSGEKRRVITDKLPYYDLEGNIIGVIAFVRDVTEQHRTEAALRVAENRFKTLVEQLPIITYVAEYKEAGHWEYVSPQIQSLLGFSPQEWVAGRGTWARQLHPEDRGRVLAEELESWKTGKRFISEYRMLARDGRVVWFRDEATVMGDNLASPSRRQGVMLDITESRKIQEDLRVTQKRLSTIVSHASVILFALDRNGVFILSEGSALKSLGLKPGEVVGRSFFDVYRNYPRAQEHARRALAGEEYTHIDELPHRNVSLEIRWSPQRDAAGNVIGVIGVATDITERRKAELLAELTKERLSMALQASSLSLWDCDVVTGKVYLSEGWSVTLGGEPRETHSTLKELRQMAHPDDQEKMFRLALETIKGRRESYREEHRVRNFKGEWLWIESAGKVVERNHKGRARRMIGTNVDITERKRAEMALKQSEAAYRSMVERAPYGIYQADPSGKLLSVNPALVEMLGYDSVEELLAVNLCTGIYRDPQEHAQIIVQNPERLDGMEVAWKRKDQTPITVRLGGRAVRDPAGALLFFDSIAEEVTETRELERQLRQAQKMEAVGRLAGGIAHDFNNLLLVIRGQLELLSDQVSETDPRWESVDQASKAADRAASLTRQLLAFGRMQVLQPRIINLNMVVTEMSKLLPPLLRENIVLTLELDSNLASVKADPGQMEQVILNLVVNARDAMPAGGDLVIETANTYLDEAYARLHPPLQAGRYVKLAVYDSGKGMDKDTQSRIFEPFFTTKEKGKGTGLGLATVYGIVKQSRGYIWVTSEPGRGASFQIYLPLVEDSAESVRQADKTGALPRGTETVLVAEDENGVRDVARHFLLKCGYQVLEASNGSEAIRIATEYVGPIHVLVTDMVMPGIGGHEAARKILQLRPEIRIVCMSGYSEHSEFQHEADDLNALRLQKPFTREALAHAVREALDDFPGEPGGKAPN